jgi:hypothetical protein
VSKQIILDSGVFRACIRAVAAVGSFRAARAQRIDFIDDYAARANRCELARAPGEDVLRAIEVRRACALDG